MPAFISKYKILEKIGEGSFSEVLKCEDRVTKEQFAAKILKKFFHNTSDVVYCAEIIAMQKLSRHANILFMHDYYFEKSSGKLILIFELMDMSMYEYMKSRKRAIPEMRVKNFLYQTLKGLDFLHRHGLFHRDIKPENILVRLTNADVNSAIFNKGELIKIADLGSIRGIYSKPPYTEYISTRWYRSPECLLTVGHYGPKMDIWASGCVFYEMLTMKPLFPGNNEIDQLAKIHQVLGTPTTRLLSKLKSRSNNLRSFNKTIGTGLGPLLSQFSEGGQTTMKLMLQYDPDIRSNARRLLQHKYFAVFREEEKHRRNASRVFIREYGDSVLPPTHCEKFPNKSSLSLEARSNCLFASRTAAELNAVPHHHHQKNALSVKSSNNELGSKVSLKTTTSTNKNNNNGNWFNTQKKLRSVYKSALYKNSNNANNSQTNKNNSVNQAKSSAVLQMKRIRAQEKTCLHLPSAKRIKI